MISPTLKTRTLILIGREDLLAKTLEVLIIKSEEWEVVQLSDQTSTENLIKEIERVKPVVLIICGGDSSHQKDLTWQLLRVFEQIKVIVIGFENDVIEIYKKEGIRIQKVADLLNVIDSK